MNEMIITSFYIVIVGKKIADGSCDSEKLSYVCIYFVISSWVLGVGIRTIDIFCDLCKKIKDWIGKRRKIVNVDETTQVRVVTIEVSHKIKE